MIAWLREWDRQRRERAALHELDQALDDSTVEAIVVAMGSYIANRPVRYCTADSLPYPRLAVEVGFLKAIKQCRDAAMLETLKGVYITLDDYFLTADEAKLMNRWHEFIIRRDHGDRPAMELVEAYEDAGGGAALPILNALNEKMHRRVRTLDEMLVKK